MTCLSASLLIAVVTMNVQPFDFTQSQKRRFKIEFVYRRSQSVQSKPVNGAGRSIAESGERFRGVAIARVEQFSKAFGCGRGFASVEASIRFTSSAIGSDVR